MKNLNMDIIIDNNKLYNIKLIYKINKLYK